MAARMSAADRAGLERMLLYVLRPALSLKQLTYAPEQDLVRYRPAKGRPSLPAVLEWTGAELEAGDELTVLGKVERAARRKNRL